MMADICRSEAAKAPPGSISQCHPMDRTGGVPHHGMLNEWTGVSEASSTAKSRTMTMAAAMAPRSPSRETLAGGHAGSGGGILSLRVGGDANMR